MLLLVDHAGSADQLTATVPPDQHDARRPVHVFRAYVLLVALIVTDKNSDIVL